MAGVGSAHPRPSWRGRITPWVTAYPRVGKMLELIVKPLRLRRIAAVGAEGKWGTAGGVESLPMVRVVMNGGGGETGARLDLPMYPDDELLREITSSILSHDILMLSA